MEFRIQLHALNHQLGYKIWRASSVSNLPRNLIMSTYPCFCQLFISHYQNCSAHDEAIDLQHSVNHGHLGSDTYCLGCDHHLSSWNGIPLCICIPQFQGTGSSGWGHCHHRSYTCSSDHKKLIGAPLPWNMQLSFEWCIFFDTSPFWPFSFGKHLQINMVCSSCNITTQQYHKQRVHHRDSPRE